MQTTLIGVAAAAVLTLVTAGGASARQSTTNTTGAQLQGSAAAAKAEIKIGRRLESTGTRMTKRACHTAEDWKKIDSAKL